MPIIIYRCMKPRRVVLTRISSLRTIMKVKVTNLRMKMMLIKNVLYFMRFEWIGKKVQLQPNSRAFKLEERIKRKREDFLKNQTVFSIVFFHE